MMCDSAGNLLDVETARHLCSNFTIVKIPSKKNHKKEIDAVKCLGHENGCHLSPSFHGDPSDNRRFDVATNYSHISADAKSFIYENLDCCKNHRIEGENQYFCKGHFLSFHGDPLRDPLHTPIEEGMIKQR